MNNTFDYIVVGAGSSGSVVARRLAEAGERVLLLEAGQASRHNDFWVKTPLGVGKLLLNSKYMWQFYTQNQKYLTGQSVYWPRGKMLGGSSSVNGMIYVRGEPAEFDHWRELGNEGWGYSDLLPYFKKIETYIEGDGLYRGKNGPIKVTNLADNPMTLGQSFIEACMQAGIPKNTDYNGLCYEGASFLQLNTKNGQRCGTAKAYLSSPIPKSLFLKTEAFVTRILFSGNKTEGVEYVLDNSTQLAFATKEVILSAGPIKSPQLLELSGIGDGIRLKNLGISVLADLPGVGENLIDHLQCRITFEAKNKITLNEIVGSFWRQSWMGAKYLFNRKGIMATPAATAHALAKINKDDVRPSVKIQMHHLSSKDRYARTKGSGLDLFPGFSIGLFQLRPNSRGWVHAETNNALDNPAIQPNYLKEQEDVDVMLAALKLARKVVSQPALSKHVVREVRPGISSQSDAELIQYIKESGQTSWHPIGTCKMGMSNDKLSVVDNQLRVKKVNGLRVVDSSIMPTMPSSNTNVASIVIGEKAADLILNR